MQRPLQTSWNPTEVGPDTTVFSMTEWASHISQRKKYELDRGAQGIDSLDSYQHRRFFEDVITRTSDGSHTIVAGSVHAGALTFVPPNRLNECGGVPNGDLPPEEMIHRAETTIDPMYVCVFRKNALLLLLFFYLIAWWWHCRGDWGAGVAWDSRGRPSNHGNTGRYYWFGDHTINVTLAGNGAYAIDRKGAAYTPKLPDVQGALCACSTTDFLSWRNEGVMVRALFRSVSVAVC